MSFLMKVLYLILAIITIAVMLNRMVSLNLLSTEESERIRLNNRALDVLTTLTHDTKCLAYAETGSVEGYELELEKHAIIDANKLKRFEREYTDTEPDCLVDYDYGYRVKVETLPLNMSFYKVKVGEGVFSKILNLIDGKKVVFLADVSGSMSEGGGKFCDQAVRKYQCLALFLAGLELDATSCSIVKRGGSLVKKCTDIGFVDLMKDESNISVIIYGTSECGVERVIDFVALDGSSQRDEIKKKLMNIKNWCIDNTPIGKAIKEGYEYAISNNADAIVLLTDGKETCKGNVLDIVDKYKNSGIPVHTIAFGTNAAVDLMERIAKETGGEFFDARSCEELLGEVKKIKTVATVSESWEFGDAQFSKEDALKDYVRVSIPVVLRYNSSLSVPARISVFMVRGELERFAGFVERVCATELESSIRMDFSYPVKLVGDPGNYKMCMIFGSEVSCKKLHCDKQVEFGGIKSKGSYIIQARVSKGVVRLIV